MYSIPLLYVWFTNPSTDSGIFGLNTQPVNFTSLGNFSSPSFISTLKDEGTIPSLSWSYTAGAKYRKYIGPTGIFTAHLVSNSDLLMF
jgi:hypothetical protein